LKSDAARAPCNMNQFVHSTEGSLQEPASEATSKKKTVLRSAIYVPT
jgi:hypothetical protein